MNMIGPDKRGECEAFIREHWNDMSPTQIADALSVSRSYISKCVRHMGLPAHKAKRSQVTEEQRDYVRTHNGDMTPHAMAKALSLPIATIRNIIREVSEWSDGDVALLRQMCGNGYTMRSMRKRFGCTSRAINAVRKRYGIMLFRQVDPVKVEPVGKVYERAQCRDIADIEADLACAVDLKDIERYRRELSCALLKKDKNDILYNDYGD